MTETANPETDKPTPAGFLPLETARNQLSTLWFVASGAVLLILVVQSLLHVYGDGTQDAWGWFLPTVMPTLSLIISVLAYTALDPQLSLSIVRRQFFNVSLALSVVYLVLVALTILIQPFAASTASDRIALMHLSNLWLGPVQGLVASALGVLFVSKQKK